MKHWHSPAEQHAMTEYIPEQFDLDESHNDTSSPMMYQVSRAVLVMASHQLDLQPNEDCAFHEYQ